METAESYLGDGVYAKLDQFGDVILMTGSHILPTNRIVLEPEVVRALVLFLEAAGYPLPVRREGS